MCYFLSFIIIKLQSSLVLPPVPHCHTHTHSMLSMEYERRVCVCVLCIVSVAAQGPCLRSASPYSFVKCSFECGLVAGGVEGGRWQQQASLFLCLCFFFFFIAPPPSHCLLAGSAPPSGRFLRCTMLCWPTLTWHSAAGIDQAKHMTESMFIYGNLLLTTVYAH